MPAFPPGAAELGSVSALPRSISNPRLFKFTPNPAQVFSGGFAVMHIALIKANIFPTELRPRRTQEVQSRGFPSSFMGRRENTSRAPEVALETCGWLAVLFH